MQTLIYLFIGSVVITIAFLVISFMAFMVYRRQALRYEQLEQKLPRACYYEHLEELIVQAEQDYEAIRDKLADAKAIVSQREEAEKWLDENRNELLKIEGERKLQEQLRTDLTNTQNQLAVKYSESQKLALEYESTEFKLNKTKEELETVSKTYAHLQDATSALQKEKSILDTEIIKMKSDIVHLDKEINIAMTKHKELMESIKLDESKMDSIRNEQSKLSSEITGMKEYKEQLQTTINSLKTDLDTASKTYTHLLDATSALQKEKDIIETETIKARSDMAYLDKEINIAMTKHKELIESIELDECKLDAIRTEHSKLSAEVKGMEVYIEKLQTIIETLKTDYERQLVKTGVDKVDGTADIWQPILRKDDFELQHEHSEQTALERTSRYLADLGLKFHKRVLYAFHTSLKVQDISPLCVLAGISGTGKSLIPQRYAEAMGIHFLNLAVQPRWDSPQDMFGFYNYLENKYRATEFARALVQMDHCWKDDNRGWHKPTDWNHSLADRMLLVLVDEMNLARVEYYFSEFLSKLESRRTIKNMNDETQRRNAEISLEVSKSGTADTMMQLMVDTNVLLVGTINEDESTQTLSDKVVDRANILRFGKPKKLETIPSTSNPTRSESYLGYTAWNDWMKTSEDLSVQESQKVNIWIEQLNGAMSKIQRPFAFRTHKAIRTYVANYPQWDGNNRLEVAMVDQIEQKILPKLRGLDPNEPNVRETLTGIIGLLNELGDEQLVGVLQQNMAYHQFVWQGIDRSVQE